MAIDQFYRNYPAISSVYALPGGLYSVGVLRCFLETAVMNAAPFIAASLILFLVIGLAVVLMAKRHRNDPHRNRPDADDDNR